MKFHVVVAMGSRSDLRVMGQASSLLRHWKIRVTTVILSAHRTPGLLQKSAQKWEQSGVSLIIAAAGGAAHLPGMLASFSVLPIIGVPIKGKAMHGLDSLLSIAQMPKGVPVATVAVDGAENAALLAAEILAIHENPQGRGIKRALTAYRREMSSKVMQDRKRLSRLGVDRFLKNIL